MEKTCYNSTVNTNVIYYVYKKQDKRGCLSFLYPHATSCGGYNVFYPSVSQSVCQSVSQFSFSCQRNSSETARQNFVKLCSYMYEGHDVKIFDSIFFPELRPFELRNLAKMKDITETVCQRNSSETTQ